MARRKKSQTLEPAVTQLRFLLNDGETNYISIPAALSLLNRRLYRQGKTYYVHSMELTPAAATTSQVDFQVMKIPNTWMSHNSWKRAKKAWQKQQRDATRKGLVSPSYGKWRDFTVLMDTVNANSQDTVLKNTVEGNWLLPIDALNNALSTSGSAVTPSEVVIAKEGTGAEETYTLHMLGDDNNTDNSHLNSDGSKAIIQGYADTRVTVGAQEPDLPGDASDSWLVEMFDPSDDLHDVIDIIETHGERPPYAHAADIQGGDNPIYPGGSETMSGGVLHSNLRTTTLGGTSQIVGGQFFGGMMKILAPVAAILTINVIPGDYKGVLATNLGQ